MGSYVLTLRGTNMRNILLALFTLIICPCYAAVSNDCGLKMEILLNDPQMAYVKCWEEGGRRSRLRWLTSSDSRHDRAFHTRAVPSLALAVLTLDWELLGGDSVMVTCSTRTKPSRRRRRCSVEDLLTMEITRPGEGYHFEDMDDQYEY